MTHDEILGKVAVLLSDILDQDEIALTDDTTAEDVEDWDSLVQVRLMIAIESAFQLRFDPDEITSPESVGQLVALIQRKLG